MSPTGTIDVPRDTVFGVVANPVGVASGALCPADIPVVVNAMAVGTTGRFSFFPHLSDEEIPMKVPTPSLCPIGLGPHVHPVRVGVGVLRMALGILARWTSSGGIPLKISAVTTDAFCGSGFNGGESMERWVPPIPRVGVAEMTGIAGDSRDPAL